MLPQPSYNSIISIPTMSLLAYSPSPFKTIETLLNLSPAPTSSGRRPHFISLARRRPLPALAAVQGGHILEKGVGQLRAQRVLRLGSTTCRAQKLLWRTLSYFMFHGMDVNIPHSIFKHLSLLSFVEAYIYKIDNLNELIVGNNMASTNAGDVCMNDPFKPLKHELERHGVLTERIIQELLVGEEYWSLERKLCAALTNRSEISVEDVVRTMCLKSFDYRVMNLILYQLRGEKVNELHMELLSNLEFLVEVSDDLHDYQKDVLKNSFNILRFFVRIYGSSAGPAMLIKYIDEAEVKCKELMKSMDPELVMKYHRRCQEVIKEDGLVFGYPFCSWSIPTVIEEDDDSYQKKMSESQKDSLQDIMS